MIHTASGKRWRGVVGGLCLNVLAVSAFAGPIYQAAMVVVPAMQVRAGAVDGCGFQLKSMAPEKADRAPVMLDVSFNLYANGMMMLKGGAVALQSRAGGAELSLPIVSFWLKLADMPATAPAGKVIPAQSAGYLLYRVLSPEFANLFSAVLDEQEIMVGVHIKGEPVERIYVGRPKPSEDEKRQMAQCAGELSRALQQSSDGAARTK